MDSMLLPVMCVLVVALVSAIVYLMFRDKSTSKGKLVKKLPMEFSKKILAFGFGAAVVIILYAMWIQYLITTNHYIGDTNIVTTLLTIMGAELTAASGFYYWKSRRENELKLQSKMKQGYIIAENDKGYQDGFNNHNQDDHHY